MPWQPGTHAGAEVMMKDQSVMWVELAARDIDLAAAFYSRMLEWKAEKHPLSPSP